MRDRVRDSLLELAYSAQFPAYGGEADACLGKQEKPHRTFLEKIEATHPELIKEEGMRILTSGLHGPLQRRCVISWTARCGGVETLEFLFDLLRDPYNQNNDRAILRDYFMSLLCLIERHEYDLNLIRRFNENISGFLGNGSVMHGYHEALRDLFGSRMRYGLYWTPFLSRRS